MNVNNNPFNMETNDYYECLNEIRRNLELVFAVAILRMPHVPAYVIQDMLFLAMEDQMATYALEEEIETHVNEHGEEYNGNHEQENDWIEEGDDGILSVFTVQPYVVMDIEGNNDVEIVEVINID